MEITKHGAKAGRPGIVTLCGTVTIGATGAVTAQTGKAWSGFTAARSAGGTYTFTLHKKYAAVTNVSVQVMEGGSTAYYTMPVSYTNGVVTVRVGAVGGSYPTDPPNPSTLLVSLECIDTDIGV